MNLFYEILLTLFGISAFILLCCFFTKYSNTMISLKNKSRIVPMWTISPQALKLSDNQEKQSVSTVSTIIEFPDKNRLHEVALVTI